MSLPLGTIIAVVGPSGCGKTTLCEYLKEKGVPMIVSYTTRPMRSGETNGREHWFVTPDQKPLAEHMLAYTRFGDYEYWATKWQAYGVCTYIIDEKALVKMQEKFGHQFIIYPVYVRRSAENLAEIDEARRERDLERVILKDSDYKLILENNGTLDEFLQDASTKILDLIKQ